MQFVMFLTITLFSFPLFASDEVVNIYSYRQPSLIRPILDVFTKKTGIKVNIVYAKNGLAERVKAEGKNSPVDLGLTVDISRLTNAKNMGITQPIVSDIVDKNIPDQFLAPDRHWVGLTKRSRVIFASRDRVKLDHIRYEDLAKPEWKGRICSRSGHDIYSIGLIASMIAHHGEEKAKQWLDAVRQNLSRKPKGNDRAQVKAIYAGLCDISLGNTYYMGKMMTNDKEPEQKEWARSVRIIFPNSQDRGAHVNLTGVFLAKYAPNKENAMKLIAFLVDIEAQRSYSEANYEYPLLAGVKTSSLVDGWGILKGDNLPLSAISDNSKRADELVDEVGFDAGP